MWLVGLAELRFSLSMDEQLYGTWKSLPRILPWARQYQRQPSQQGFSENSWQNYRVWCLVYKILSSLFKWFRTCAKRASFHHIHVTALHIKLPCKSREQASFFWFKWHEVEKKKMRITIRGIKEVYNSITKCFIKSHHGKRNVSTYIASCQVFPSCSSLSR